jgi:transcriptional regulator of arginine metabolism
MRENGSSPGKLGRQRLIESLVARKRVGTQHELLKVLAAAGCRVTQATISRDIQELRLEKTHDQLGRPRYTMPQRGDRADPREALTTILSQFGQRATAAQNVVVLASELGTAPAIARALDRLGHPKVVGTLAGDDTTLVITPAAADARVLARELAALIAS